MSQEKSSPVASSRRIYREIADLLSERIDNGEYPVGSRMPPERELAEELQVSRSSVREALIALEIGGYVDVRLGSGIYVRNPLPARQRHAGTHAHIPLAPPASASGEEEISPFSILEARLLIEPECAALAALALSNEDLNALKALHQRMLASATWDDDDRQFHALINNRCGNAALVSTADHLWRLTQGSRLYRRMNQHIVTAAVWEQNLLEHEYIVHSLANRDPSRARYALQQHLLGIMSRLRDVDLS